ncbi:MAG: hypothetical protein HYT89_05140 [Candidatus Omnitrophica bacterium]|nr:hypothetical protein [Candidatus Omnitrophota bacterium]
MTAPRIFFSVFVFFWASCSGLWPVFAAEGPDISLSADYRRQTDHLAEDPLLIRVGLGNPSASEARSRNESTKSDLDKFVRTAGFGAWPEEKKAGFMAKYSGKPVPVYGIGSATRAPADQVRLVLKNAAGEAVFFNARLLAATDRAPGEVLLDGTKDLVFYFGADPETLLSLGEGRYALEAVVTSRKAGEGRDSETVSKAVEIFLVKNPGALSKESADRRLASSAVYYHLDGQYSKLAETAEKILAKDPRSVDGWAYLGDALDGRGDSREALKAFENALRHWPREAALQPREGPKEEPRYIYRRIEEIKDKLTRGGG